MRIWITDGSPAPFADVIRLSASHPGTMGGDVAYKGALDGAVPVGRTAVLMEDPSDCLVPEAEWCICFPDGTGAFLADPSALNDSTHIVLQGMIEGKWLNRLGDGMLWKPASIGNNLLAEGTGIPTTFAAVESGAVNGAIDIRYTCHAGRQTQSASVDDLRGHNILGLARAVFEYCREQGLSAEAVNCSARGPNSALAEDRAFLGRVLAAARVTPAELAMPAAWATVMREAVKIAAGDGLMVETGAPVELVVTVGSDVVGSGRMTVVPHR
jgi:hypothetical protein